MSDLVERLLAAIAEREQAAEAAKGDTAGLWGRTALEADIVLYDASGKRTMGQFRHIALNDPQSVLRLCQAHREIINHWKATKTAVEVSEGTILAGATKVRLGAYDNVIKALAGGYGIQEDG